MVESELIALGEKVVKRFKNENLTLSTAESCTGGWLSKIITEISGASEIFMGGVCSYSNDIKINVLGVKEETLKTVLTTINSLYPTEEKSRKCIATISMRCTISWTENQNIL